MGPQGHTGFSGPTGIQGIQGIQGITGLKGDPGHHGPTGVQGITGLSIIGHTGAMGVTGQRGPMGYGVTGMSGKDGATGIQGSTGVAGGEYNKAEFSCPASIRPGDVISLVSENYVELANAHNIEKPAIGIVEFKNSTTRCTCVLTGPYKFFTNTHIILPGRDFYLSDSYSGTIFNYTGVNGSAEIEQSYHNLQSHPVEYPKGVTGINLMSQRLGKSIGGFYAPDGTFVYDLFYVDIEKPVILKDTAPEV